MNMREIISNLTPICLFLSSCSLWSLETSFKENSSQANQIVDARGFLYSPYWYTDPLTEATIEITNNASEHRTILPKIILFGESEIHLDPLSLPPTSTIRVSLSSLFAVNGMSSSESDDRWGDGSRENSYWGSAVLEGETLQGITSWIISENKQERISVSSIFRNLTRSSSILKTLWSRPTEDTTSLYAIQNASSEDQIVDTFFHFEGRNVPGQSFTISPKKSLLLKLEDIFPLEELPLRQNHFGGIEFKSRTTSGKLLGRAISVYEELGFSTTWELKSPHLMVSKELQLPGVMTGIPESSLGYPQGTKFQTQLHFSNTGNDAIKLSIIVHKSQTNPSLKWELPEFTIAPHTYFSAIIEDSLPPNLNDNIWAEIKHSGDPENLIIESITSSDNLDYSMSCPVFDIRHSASINIAVSFNFEADKNTLLLIKNSSNQTTIFGYVLNYEHEGSYHEFKIGPAELAPREMKVINLKKLRDEQVMDTNGNSIWQRVGRR